MDIMAFMVMWTIGSTHGTVTTAHCRSEVRSASITSRATKRVTGMAMLGKLRMTLTRNMHFPAIAAAERRMAVLLIIAKSGPRSRADEALVAAQAC
jgi:hypothetical protein